MAGSDFNDSPGPKMPNHAVEGNAVRIREVGIIEREPMVRMRFGSEWLFGIQTFEFFQQLNLFWLIQIDAANGRWNRKNVVFACSQILRCRNRRIEVSNRYKERIFAGEAKGSRPFHAQQFIRSDLQFRTNIAQIQLRCFQFAFEFGGFRPGGLEFSQPSLERSNRSKQASGRVP